jgi:hypothetical protein
LQEIVQEKVCVSDFVQDSSMKDDRERSSWGIPSDPNLRGVSVRISRRGLKLIEGALPATEVCSGQAETLGSLASDSLEFGSSAVAEGKCFDWLWEKR